MGILRLLTFVLLLSAATPSWGQLARDTLTTDTVAKTLEVYKAKKKKRYIPIITPLYHFVQEFSRVDTNYVEPQHYNYTVMLQNTNTYEVYRISSGAGQEVVFAPKPSYRLGPYFGWRWIFLGYTIDLTHLGSDSKKQDFNLSLYSNQIGVDIFYRKSGTDYRISRVNLGTGYDLSDVKDVAFEGFQTSIKGFNLYYIFNHRKFSYPAAYSQSTVQRRSYGSPMLGIGYTKHNLNIDLDGLRNLLDDYIPAGQPPVVIDTTMMVNKVSYTDYSLSGGYAYNWVFAYNWLFDISLQAALGYKHTVSDTEDNQSSLFRNFDFKNLNLDGIIRVGVVWNNTRWYFGSSAVFHTYHYSKSQFSTNNMFGNVNFYVGYNFSKR